MEELTEVEDLQFEWGKKRGIGGKKKDAQFYESFTYDGEEYSLYDCVLVCKDCETEPFVGKIIKIWERIDKSRRVKTLRGVKLLWFFKPSEILPYLEGVPGILANELFLASGDGVGLANVNPLEAIGGKCSVICISKDRRNPQPSDEEIKKANFVFHRTFDVGRCKVLDQIDDKIAGVDVKFIFNRTSGEKEAISVRKVEADVEGNPECVKPDGPLTIGSVRQSARESSETSGSGESGYGGKKGKENEVHKQLARQKSTLAEEGSTKDSCGQDDRARYQCDFSKASGYRESGYGGKDGTENERQKCLARQKSMLAEERPTKDDGGLDNQSHNEHDSSEASGSGESGYGGKRANENECKKWLVRQKSMLGEERYTKDSGGLDDRPLKKQKLDDSVTVSDDRIKKSLQKISSEGGNGTKPPASLENPRDKVKREEVLSQKLSIDEKKKKSMQALSVAEGKDTKTVTPVASHQGGVAIEKGLYKNPSFEDKLSKCTEGKMLMDGDYKRNYQAFEVTRRPDAERSKWFRKLPWEERMYTAQEQGTLVMLQNLDPTYTSDEVEDIVYSCLNEQCTARMIERTSASIPHIGEALVIFKTRDAAERVVTILHEGCLLLSSGRPLVASFAKTTPPGKPPPFAGHIKLKNQIQREMRDAVATSHCSQPNTIEYDMAMEWCLHQARYDHTWGKLFKQQRDKRMKLRVNFKPKSC